MACKVYDIHRTWYENLQQGPLLDAVDTPRPLSPPTTFLGFPVASPLGVPAGPLLNSEYVSLAARLGYDILTYKTVRTHATAGHGLPNVLYVAAPGQLHECGQREVVERAADVAECADAVTITNSFGMPSMGPEYVLEDVARAAACLRPDQLLVVSVTGTHHAPSGATFEEDFCEAAELAVRAGARVVEANLSCPNVGAAAGALYLDPAAVERLTRVLKAALGPRVPLIVKVGAFDTYEAQRDVMLAAARGGAAAVSGINGIGCRVRAASGEPALGVDRPTSGVCGAAIREAALRFVERAARAVREEGLDMQIVGVGGITRAQHVEQMLAAGAHVVQSATGMMWNPQLAHEYHLLAAKKAAAPAAPAPRSGHAA